MATIGANRDISAAKSGSGKRHWNHGLAGAHAFPKFVQGRAAREHDLRKVGTGFRWGRSAVIASRGAGLPVAVIAALVLLFPLRASAQWWSRAPADFEDCAAAAEKSDSKEAKTAALAECNAKFAGRPKAG